MHHIFRRGLPALVLLGLGFRGEMARAHIELLAPTSRYPLSVGGANKACPCGVGETNRRCDDPDDRSDPDRSTAVSRLVAGSTITFRWDEYIGHSGRYRIAFDPEGADLEDFNQNILLDVPDPPGGAGNLDDGTSVWEVEVTLPDMLCDDCTLQLVQMMDGNTLDPVLDPAGRSSYYTCADIALIAEEGDTATTGVREDDGGGTTDGGTTDGGTTGTTDDGTTDDGAGSTDEGVEDTTGGASSGADGAGGGSSSAEDGGSGSASSRSGGCRVAPGGGSAGWAWLGLLGLGPTRRRRRP